MTRWEYRIEVERIDGRITADALNALGAEGWEFVAWIPENGEAYAAAVFKRPRLA